MGSTASRAGSSAGSWDSISRFSSSSTRLTWRWRRTAHRRYSSLRSQSMFATSRRPDSRSDGPSGRPLPQGIPRGLTRTPIDTTVSFSRPVDRPRRLCLDRRKFRTKADAEIAVFQFIKGCYPPASTRAGLSVAHPLRTWTPPPFAKTRAPGGRASADITAVQGRCDERAAARLTAAARSSIMLLEAARNVSNTSDGAVSGEPAR